ncbi:MAG: hypothetical protein KC435_13410 [Thermomicrobiales bacterium]|nr:hypothetical protein [Thermomicrobiales bacterium]
MARSTDYVTIDAPVSDEIVQAIRALDNNSLALRLHFTIHHLSRWITPIHDRNKLERSRHYGEPTVRDLVLLLRDHEQYIYPKLFIIANESDPDLDEMASYQPNASAVLAAQNWSTVELLGAFRRLRQSTCGLLRQMPDAAWSRRGYSRKHENVTMRQLAEQLAEHDYRVLRAMDATLWDSGARDSIAEIQTASLDELLELVPRTMKI